jgi:hypothetical protein
MSERPWRRIYRSCIDCPAWEDAPLMAPLLWPLMIAAADWHGVLPRSSTALRAILIPHQASEVSAQQVEDALLHLERHAMITTYTAEDGRRYLQLARWDEYQPQMSSRRDASGLYPRPVQVASTIDALATLWLNRVGEALRPREVEHLAAMLETHGESTLRDAIGRMRAGVRGIAYLRTTLANMTSPPAAPAARPSTSSAPAVRVVIAEVPRGRVW